MLCKIIPFVQTSLVPQDHNHNSQRCQQASVDPYILSLTSCKPTLNQINNMEKEWQTTQEISLTKFIIKQYFNQPGRTLYRRTLSFWLTGNSNPSSGLRTINGKKMPISPWKQNRVKTSETSN